MRTPGRGARWVAAALLLLALAACGKKATEDVRVRVEGSQLRIDNRSGADIHLSLEESSGLLIPFSTPQNRLADGQSRQRRIAPSQRPSSIQVAWWRPGDKLAGSEIRGADRLRRMKVDVPESVEPMAIDEVFVRTCIKRAAAAHQVAPGTPYYPTVAEDECMKTTAEWCANPGQCARRLEQERDDLARMENSLLPQRATAAAAAAAAASTSGSASTPADDLAPRAREAFLDLREGKVDRYVARLCASIRESYSGAFMQSALRKTGQDFARRGLEPGKVAEQDANHIVFTAIDEAMLSGRAPTTTALRIKASFEREGDRPCLMELAELR